MVETGVSGNSLTITGQQGSFVQKDAGEYDVEVCFTPIDSTAYAKDQHRL